MAHKRIVSKGRRKFDEVVKHAQNGHINPVKTEQSRAKARKKRKKRK